MSFPTIRTARKLAKELRLQGTVIIGFEGGQVCACSYGATKAQCRELAALVDHIILAIELQEVPLESLGDDGELWAVTPTEEAA